ncbi:MAG: RT0821/Lpp0805 family surface protein [Alphaproteobacteria bacterium]
MILIKYLVIGSLVLPLAACSNHQDTGTLVGAVTGGVIGNQFGKGKGRVLATVAGAVVGGLIGNSIGKDLDEADRRMAEEAEYRALEEDDLDEPVRWRGRRSGNYGYVRQRRTYRHHGRKCREYEHTIYVDGRPETMVGRACRRPDGTWRQV